MGTKVKAWALGAVLVVLLFGLGQVDAARIGGGGGGSGVTGWPTNLSTRIMTGLNSFANAAGFGKDASDYWAIGHDSVTGLFFDPVCAGVRNDCDFVRTLLSGRYWEMLDNTSSRILKLESAAATFGKQVVTAGSGIEFTESDTNPTCASGNYTIFADTSEAKLKKCQNGVASDLSSSTDPTGHALKASNETVNNSSTFQNDDALVVAVDANSTYAIEWFINYEATTAADAKFQFTVPSGATGRRNVHFIGTGVTSCNSTGQTFYGAGLTTSWSAGGIGAGSSCDAIITMTATTVGTAGSITLQWAQDVAEVSDAIVRAGSYVTWRKLN